jgi:hypothetical protein
VDYHYILILRFVTPEGHADIWSDGTYRTGLRDTRSSVYKTLRDQMIARHPEFADRDPAPQFFSLEPNRLPLTA